MKRQFKTFQAHYADGCIVEAKAKTRRRFILKLKRHGCYAVGPCYDSHLVKIIRKKSVPAQ